MANGRALFSFALICLAFAMLVAVGVAHEGHEHPHSPASSPLPGENGGSAAADFPPHLFSTTLFASFAFLVPFCLSIIY
ncbi:hypothetical protein ACOSQ2_001932 [Xanthoceras sorbifolium]|uniref:Transmembrane protein n=1 Tax=Xanthoceras sorbifolium TaxID=99658 RepID=A0ABQ8IKM4_9ROSI|nr:hypothetical protein JRO89_XS01G0227200 [Xanthoceras sorbifolium]